MTTDIITRNDLIETKRHRLRKWVQRGGVIFAVLGPLVIMLAGLGSKFGLWSWKFGLSELTPKLGVPLLGLSLLLGVIGILLWFFVQPRKGIILSLVAVIVPLLGFMQVGSIKGKANKLPYIHDITTNTQAPPEFTNAIIEARGSDSNTLDYIGKKDPTGSLVSVLQSNAYPDIRPVLRSEDKAVVFGEALSLVKQQGWDIVTEDLESGTIEATASTFWYGFKDDVVIQIRDGEGGGTLVDMRSVSRVGMSDIGANAKRLGILIDGLKE